MNDTISNLAAVLFLGTLVLGCGREPGQPSPVEPDERPGVEPRFQALLDAEVAKPEVHNAMARVQVGDTLVFAGAAGTFSNTDATPIQPDTPFRSASVGKLFTSTVVLQLVEQGKLSPEQTLGELLPRAVWERLHMLNGVSRGGELTVEQLVAHTTGLPDVDSDPAFNGAVAAEPERVWEPEELLEFAIAIGPDFAPGEGQVYSSANYWLLGLVIEAVTGKEYHRVVREQILDRLGLASTFEETHEGPGPRPLAHSYIGDLDVNLASPSFEFADGGFVSTLADLSRFGRALGRGELFTRPETLEAMLTSRGSMNIGLGAWLGEAPLASGRTSFFYHPGYWGVGLFVFPEKDTVIAYTVNQAQTDVSELLSGLAAALP